ncbi:MAG: 3-phosphoglycerate dehydrogenase [Candidatus Competibacteraceae bacterium]|nr:3-phosphoglycerate dehydrogenase [Candidatus Competibacteraceae bacterium]MCB1815740.1 3-phosphoglycerate dehydrogenase [Candidatus Competibacteraceae bacterium]
MYKVLMLNNIQAAGLERLPRDRFQLVTESQQPDALLLRSYNLHDWPIPASLLAVGRAGAGVNNIPLTGMSKRGIAVFNAPGANANAVKELVLAGMLLAARNLYPALNYVRELKGSESELNEQVEAGKKRFTGFELPGRTLGVIGLGNVGVRVANAAEALGLRVIGYDPNITVGNAWQLSAKVKQIMSVSDLLAQADFVTLHVPMLDDTRHLINAERLRKAKPGLTLLNFARAGVVDEQAVRDALVEQRLHAYVCDFPSVVLQGHPNVIALPHLGASTQEAEENCAIMVAEQIRDYLEHGTVRNSVNFPSMEIPRTQNTCRLLIVNANIPHMIERISTAIARLDINILDMLNRSRGDIACTLIDVTCPLPPTVVDEISRIEGVLRVRLL